MAFLKRRMHSFRGSKDLSADTFVELDRSVIAAFRRYFPGQTIEVIRTDSFSLFKSVKCHEMLMEMLIHPEHTPPGQHAFCDTER
eukprot:3510499-Prymnesium_polylepis.1